MTGEMGELALCLALALAILQSLAGLAGARESAGLAQRLASSAAIGVLVFVSLAFGALIFAFVTSDFSIVDVQQNSNTAKPLLYKIAGAWGNHEGSMVLWVFVLSLYAGWVAFAQRGGARLTAAALGVGGLLASAFLLFILLTSNPFLRLYPPPFEGAGLNPLLQDPGLALHPPILYAGYVGLSATFAYAAAGLITGEAEAAWARAARPFMLAAWTALTLGITMGSWWAYYTLGWGGFWFWDPVENASLMPWLVATALLHSALATERTGAFRTWTLLLSILGFSLSLIGTFLVRSGVLNSVHAFANDPERGFFILLMLVLAIGGAFALFAWQAPKFQGGSAFDPVSRETSLLLNNMLLVAAAGTVLIGTLYPLALDALTGRKISVGAPYFAITFAPILALLLLLLPFGPRLGWRRGDLGRAARELWPAAATALFGTVLVLAIARPVALEAAAAFALAIWLIGSSAVDMAIRARDGSFGWKAAPSALAHAGLGITLLGIAAVSAWKSEAQDVLGPGEKMKVGNYELVMRKVFPVNGPNYVAQRASIDVKRDNQIIAALQPEKRAYPTEGQAISKTAIRTTGLSDLYVALGDERQHGRWVVRAYVNPLAPFIWFGGAIMGLGGLLSLLSRLRMRAHARLRFAPAE